MSVPGEVGKIAWVDLTVPDAEKLRDFYREVVGWTITPVKMGDYSDYCMNPPGSEQPAAGICHARGDNAGLPPQWLIYITVHDLDASIARCKTFGGKILAGPKTYGEQARYCVIQDPAGAVAALFCPFGAG